MRTMVRAAIRIIIIFLFIETLLNGIRYCGYYIQTDMSDMWLYLLVTIGIIIISFVILFFLWWKTDWLVNVLAGEVSNHELVITTSNLDLFKVAIRILGIYLLIDSIPALLGLIGNHFSFLNFIGNNDPKFYPELYAGEIRNGIIIGVKILIGFWMILGTKGIGKVLDIIDAKVHMTDKEPNKEDNP